MPDPIDPNTHGHPLDYDLYTPWTPELATLLERMKVEHGTWRQVAALSGMRLKVLRNLRQGKRKAVGQRTVDRLCTTTGVGGVHEFTWFTAQDLVALGIWEPPMFIRGPLKRSQGGHDWETTREEKRTRRLERQRLAEAERLRRERKAKRAYRKERKKWLLPKDWKGVGHLRPRRS